MATQTEITEADIMEQVVAPDDGNMDPDAARAVLSLKFDGATAKQIRRLLQKNNKGTITAEDRILLERYLRVGKLIDLLHAKARLSLQRTSR